MHSRRRLFTFKFDLIRSTFFGFQQAWLHTLALLVLIKYFDGSDTLSSLVFGSTFVGMMGSIFYSSMVRKWTSRKSTAVALPIFVSGLFMILAAFSTGKYFYAVAVILAFATMPLQLPTLSSIYHDNYPSLRRGKFVSYSMILTQFVAFSSTWLGGYILDWRIEFFRVLLFATGFGSLISAWFTAKIPTKKLSPTGRNPLSALRWIYQDPLFGYILLVWFIFGFANLWCMPMRIKYLSVELALPASTVAIVYGAIPEIVRFLLTPFWAWVFDRMNFILLRIILNVFLMFGSVFFFFTENIYVIALGSLLYGIGFAGGRIAWSLWTTKMVDPSRTSDYMSVHVASTGLRGAIGPFIGFWAFTQIGENPYQTMGLISAGLILLSILMLIPVVRYGNR